MMYNTFTLDPLHEEDIVVYLKNERTGSSTVRKCKFIGCITGFTNTKVEIRRLSPPDIFVTLEETKDFGIDVVCPDDVVHVIISKYQLDNWMPLPQTIGGITFYDKKELIGWVEWQQEFNTKWIERFKHRDCHHCKNGTHKIVVTQPNGAFIRYENFCSECGRDLRNL